MSNSRLRRYTELPALVYLLTERKITLLDPQSWDDKNDSRYLELYREKKKLACVLALCFTQAGESYHHWRVFGSGSAGVCIRFNRSQLLEALKQHPGVRTGIVKYRTLQQIRTTTPRTRQLPFLKRFGFAHEKEFRITYESQKEAHAKLDIPIPLSSIERITLSPWIHSALTSHVKQLLKSIRGCSTLDIVRSTLVSNQEWQRHGESAA